MRRIATIALLCTVALSACSSASGSPEGDATSAYASPDAMRAKVSSTLPLSECSAPTRDAYGVMFTQCLDSTGGLVRLSVVDVGAEAALVQSMTDTGWKATSGPGWVAGVNSDQSTLEKVRASLS